MIVASRLSYVSLRCADSLLNCVYTARRRHIASQDNARVARPKRNSNFRRKKGSKISPRRLFLSRENMTTEEKFNAAVNVIRNLPKNGNFFYAYITQSGLFERLAHDAIISSSTSYIAFMSQLTYTVADYKCGR